ncbi:MAG TPA: RimK/LysX family protein [Candidatus Saccharimonadales bacterium]|nr:RimK/LysX family protein [Candidatus Saccharimonadales bacterium]
MTNKTIIGCVEKVKFSELELPSVPARIDTGATTSAVWATDIKEVKGTLYFTLFGKGSEYYNGVVIKSKSYEQRSVTSSNGISEDRYVVKFLIQIAGRKIHASFTLANRSGQTYPVLVGRNILRGKFLVDVKHGQPDTVGAKE